MKATRCMARSPIWLSALGAAMLMTACGGGSRVEAISVTAQDERFTMAWRSSASFDVLANDSASRGGVVLEAVTPPAHGSAVIEGGQIRYTPVDGWFGTDAVRYTVRAADGRVTAEATLRVDVQARLALSGVITDAPVADAAVTVRVGDEAIETTADEEGRYTVEVISSEPDALVSVEGLSPDERVRLVSWVGALRAVAAAASSEDGAVDSATLPALDATHWSTAAAALILRANGGEPPADAEALAGLAAAAADPELLRLATAIRMVADLGVELPEGVADTFALVQDETTAVAFIDANGAVFAQAMPAVLAEAPRANVALALEGPRSFVVSLGTPASPGAAVMTLRPDGSALLTMQATLRGMTAEASWTEENGRLEVRYLPETVPERSFVLFGQSSDPNSNSAGELAVVDQHFGVVLQLVSGDWTQGLVSVELMAERRYARGPAAGQLARGQPYGVSPVLWTLIDTASAEGFAADDVASGSRLAGILSRSPPRSFNDDSTGSEDILRIDGPGIGTLEISGLPVTWALQAGWLRVEVEGAMPLRYTRLGRNPTLGFDTWKIEGEDADGPDAVRRVVVGVRIAEGLGFTPELAARHWRAELGRRFAPESPLFAGRLFPNGSVTGLNATRWRIDDAGVLELTGTFVGTPRVARWVLLEVLGPNILVLETLRFGAPGTSDLVQRVNWYFDLGPSTE